MTAEEQPVFPGSLFPTSHIVLYCPFPDCNISSGPFCDGQKILGHLFDQHKIRIHNPEPALPFLDAYLREAVGKFDTTNLHSDGFRVIGGTGDDRELRDRLQRKKLKDILEVQAQERATSYPIGRECLFCSEVCSDKPTLFAHMFQVHSFNIGQLDNLVFVDEFIHRLAAKLATNTCLYCERTYSSEGLLRKHVKAKGHYRINPQNHEYDRYYVINYVQNGKLWQELEADQDGDEEDRAAKSPIDNQENFESLNDPIDERTMCLFCNELFSSPECSSFRTHLKELHNFDLCHLDRLGDEYSRIKAITYLRDCLRRNICPAQCQTTFEDEESLFEHLSANDHARLPCDRSIWDQPQYLFPVYDDDPLLWSGISEEILSNDCF